MVRVVRLVKKLGDFQLRHISLEVARGEYAVLLGPTGSGKTVLLETLVGISRPDKGEVWIDGADVTRLPPEKRGIGFVYQRSMLFPHLSVRRNVGYGLRYHGASGAEADGRIGRVAALLGIEALLDREVHALSGGEMQKVALARALAIEPRILLLDEPLAPLDPLTKEALRGELRRLHERTGMTILHVTHDQETARVLGHSIGVMVDGRLLQFGPKDEVFNRPSSAAVAWFVGTENVFQGRVAEAGEPARIELGCGPLLASTERRGQVGVCVRPELIAVEPADAPARDGWNRVEGLVESVSDRGALVRYQVVTTQERFVAVQTKKDYAAGGHPVGQRVSLSFEPAAVHVFDWEGR